MATQDPSPLSVYYMAQVLEERPFRSARLGPRIGSRFLPIQGFSTYRIVWDKIREYSPMAGPYAMEDLPNTLDELDFETFQSDVLHWGTRMSFTAKDLMFLRVAGQSNITNATSPYGVGPAADDYRARDANKIAESTRMMNEAMANVMELLQMHSLLGQIWWPPRDENGNIIAAAGLPLSMGRQGLNHPVPFLAAGADGGFHQTATGLVGVAGGINGTGVPWNLAGSNMIGDMAVVMDLLDERMALSTDSLLVLMAKRVLGHQAANANILNWILGTTRDRTFMTTGEIRDFIQTQFEWTIEFYQSKWEYVLQNEFDQTHPTVHSVPYMGYGTVLIIPNPEIQQMGVVATTPAPGPAYNWQDGKYFWMERNEKPPWVTQLGMGAFWWPLIWDTDLRFRLDAWT